MKKAELQTEGDSENPEGAKIEQGNETISAQALTRQTLIESSEPEFFNSSSESKQSSSEREKITTAQASYREAMEYLKESIDAGKMPVGTSEYLKNQPTKEEFDSERFIKGTELFGEGLSEKERAELARAVREAQGYKEELKEKRLQAAEEVKGKEEPLDFKKRPFGSEAEKPFEIKKREFGPKENKQEKEKEKAQQSIPQRVHKLEITIRHVYENGGPRSRSFGEKLKLFFVELSKIAVEILGATQQYLIKLNKRLEEQGKKPVNEEVISKVVKTIQEQMRGANKDGTQTTEQHIKQIDLVQGELEAEKQTVINASNLVEQQKGNDEGKEEMRLLRESISDLGSQLAKLKQDLKKDQQEKEKTNKEGEVVKAEKKAEEVFGPKKPKETDEEREKSEHGVNDEAKVEAKYKVKLVKDMDSKDWLKEKSRIETIKDFAQKKKEETKDKVTEELKWFKGFLPSVQQRVREMKAFDAKAQSAWSKEEEKYDARLKELENLLRELQSNVNDKKESLKGLKKSKEVKKSELHKAESDVLVAENEYNRYQEIYNEILTDDEQRARGTLGVFGALKRKASKSMQKVATKVAERADKRKKEKFAKEVAGQVDQ